MAAFYNCDALVDFEFPESVEHIEKQAFSRCYDLVDIVLPDSVNCIEAEAFYGCFELKSIDIPDSVKVIGERAFVACTWLSTATIGEGSQLESIGAYAFSNCKITSIFLPSTVTTISQNAFECCRELEVINYAGTEAQWNDILKETDWDYYAGELTENGTYAVVYNYEFPTK